jgi:hypothetical protein
VTSPTVIPENSIEVRLSTPALGCHVVSLSVTASLKTITPSAATTGAEAAP